MPSDYSINFYGNLIDAQTKLNPLGRYYTSSNTTIWIRIEDDSFNCFGVVSFNAIVNPEIILDIEELYTICKYSELPLVLDGGNNTTWQWKKSNSNIVLSTNRYFEIPQTGNYSVIVTKLINGLICSESKNFKVEEAEVPVLNLVESNEDGSIFVSVKGIATYTYSLDASNYEGYGTSHTFSNLTPGIYNVFVKDASGCEIIIAKDIYVFKFPKFFTPNGDGINDYWKIYGVSRDYFSKLELAIFDRYGRLLRVLNLHQNQFGWDGVFNKEKLPESDYWYKMTLIDLNNNTQIKKGHFSLIR